MNDGEGGEDADEKDEEDDDDDKEDLAWPLPTTLGPLSSCLLPWLSRSCFSLQCKSLLSAVSSSLEDSRD